VALNSVLSEDLRIKCYQATDYKPNAETSIARI